MKKVFLDTNVLIDYLARRGQFFRLVLHLFLALGMKTSDDNKCKKCKYYEDEDYL